MEQFLLDGHLAKLYNLIYWILVSYSVTSIIVEAKITTLIRSFPNYIAKTSRYYVIQWFMKFIHSLITCFLCTSVWVSAFFSIFILDNTELYKIFTDSMFATAIMWFLHCIEYKLTK